MVVGNGSSKPSLAGTTALNPRRWYHLVVTRDGAAVAVYLDGKPEVAGTLVEGPAVTSLGVGGEPGSVSSFEGKVDEVAVFDRVLSAAEAAALHTAFRE